MTARRSLARKAEALLAAHGVDHPPVDVQGLAEAHGITVLFEPMDDSVSGFLVQREDATLIGVNSSHPPTRQRFTLAHELAHYQLHAGKPTVYVDDAMFFRDQGAGEPDPQEVDANAFAAALLMPEEFLRRDIGSNVPDMLDEFAVRRLAQRYKVSPQALTIRLMELGLGAMGGVRHRVAAG
jgi:Zn-dependent peptidase ImmA (M78 family)